MSHKKLLLLFIILAICTIPILPHSFLPQPEGFVNADIVLIQGRLAFLSIEASGVRKPILIEIDFIEKKILWQIKTLGKIKEFIFNDKNQIITIENDTLISRKLKDGKIIWQRDLRKISTHFSERSESDRSGYWSTSCGLCIPDPLKAENFGYYIFISDIETILLVRNILLLLGEDWIQFNLNSGDVVSKGCDTLFGHTKSRFWLKDCDHIYEFTKQGLIKVPIKEKVDNIEIPSFDFQKYWASSKWFFVQSPDYHHTETGTIVVFFPDLNDFRTITIAQKKEYQTKLVSVGDYILNFSVCLKYCYKLKKELPLFWMECYNLDGSCINRKEEIPIKSNYFANFLGKTKNGEVLISINQVVKRYLIPNLELISQFEFYQDDFFFDSFTEHDGHLIGAFKTGNIWVGKMKKKKDKGIVSFKFFDFETEKELWVLKIEVPYFKIRKRSKIK